MSWTKQDQTTLDHLRRKELSGTLSEPEQGELAALTARVEAEEAQALAPAMAALRTQVAELDLELSAVHGESEKLTRLLAEQQSLAADARRFLAELDRRSASISEALALLAGGPLPAV